MLEWLEQNTSYKNPLKDARKVTVKTNVTAKIGYLDI